MEIEKIALQKYMDNDFLTINDVWDLLQQDLYRISEEQYFIKSDDYSAGLRDGEEAAIRRAMDFIQRIK